MGEHREASSPRQVLGVMVLIALFLTIVVFALVMIAPSAGAAGGCGGG
jgi:hypothetical protein